MAAPLRVTLGQAAKAELERRYQTTRDATTRTRYQMVLLRAEGHPVVEVAHLTRCSPDTVRRVLRRYLGHGPDAVPHRPHLGQPPHYPPAWQAELVRVADLDPHEVGVDSALWSCRLLADDLHGVTGHRAGIETVRIALHRAGYLCKRPRWVLTRKAPAQPGWANRLRVEALPGAAASPLPPPAACLVPDATLADDLFSEDLPRLLGLLERADL
jgi:transposase